MTPVADSRWVLHVDLDMFLAAVEQDKPVRLLGVRLEMVPPEGGY